MWLVGLEGGNQPNVITREANAVIACVDVAMVKEKLFVAFTEAQAEFLAVECVKEGERVVSGMKLSVEEVEAVDLLPFDRSSSSRVCFISFLFTHHPCK